MLQTNYLMYSWARGLDTQINGKQLANVNAATDDATTALRTVSQDAYNTASLISIYNRDLVLPRFDNLATPPSNFLSNLRGGFDLVSGAADGKKTANWADVVYMYRFLRGFAYVPADGEYFALFDAIKNARLAPVPYMSLYSLAVATLPFQNRLATDVFFQTALYLPNAPVAPGKQPFYPVASEAVVTGWADYADKPSNPPVDSTGSSASHNDGMAALAVGSVGGGRFVMKGQLRSNFLDGVTLIGSNIVNNATASQFLAHAALTGKLTGASVIVDASDVAKAANAPGAGVSFMYRSLPAFGAAPTTFFGFRIGNVLNFKFVDDYDAVGNNVQTIQFAFEVVDNPVVQGAPRLADYIGPASTVMACADDALRLRFALTLSNLYSA